MSFSIGDRVAVITKSGKRILFFDTVEFVNVDYVRLKGGYVFTARGACVHRSCQMRMATDAQIVQMSVLPMA